MKSSGATFMQTLAIVDATTLLFVGILNEDFHCSVFCASISKVIMIIHAQDNHISCTSMSAYLITVIFCVNKLFALWLSFAY